MIGIYTIRCLLDNKYYVGESLNWRKRLAQHLSDLRGNRHSNIHLQRGFNKYGESNFEFEGLEECDEKFLKSTENYWANLLDAHNPEKGYNLDSCDPYGICRKKSQETKNLISKKAKERDTFGENNPFFGKIHSQEALNIMSRTHKGKTLSEEHKQALKLSHPKGADHWSSKRVINVETGEIYGTIKEAAKNAKINYVTFKDYMKGNIVNKTKYKLYDEMGNTSKTYRQT